MPLPVHPEYHRPLQLGLGLLVACLLGLAAVAWVPALHFELPEPLNAGVHAVLEGGAVAIALMVFAVGWASQDRERTTAVPLVSAVFLAVAVLDQVHLLSFPGMPSIGTPSGTGKAIVPFLAARLLVMLAMLALAFLPGLQRAHRQWPFGRWVLLAASLSLAALVSGATLLDPTVGALFFDAQGLTKLKIGIEYTIVCGHLAAAWGLARRLRFREPTPLAQALVANLLMALSGFCFTLYASPQDQFNNYGHLLKIAAYAAVWRAMFWQVVVRPYQLLEGAQAQLKSSEARYRLLFERSTDAVMLHSRDARQLIAANPAASRLLGEAEGDLRGRNPREYIDPTDTRMETFAADLQRQGWAHGELRAHRRDGTALEVEADMVAFDDASGNRLASIIFRDVTERNSSRRQILQLNAELEQRVKARTAQLETVNRELEAFSYTVAHDLRQPLGAVRGFAEALALRSAGQLDAESAQYLDRINAASASMVKMIDALLELARLARSNVHLEPLDLAQLANEVVQQLRASEPQRGVEVQVHGPLPVRGDPQLLRLALDNLLANAWKFTARCEHPVIEVGCTTDAGERVFYVRDNGAGFDMADADRLFSVFRRLHRQDEFPGTGIGLANVSRIVTMHGGRIWAQAQPGQGATFYFTLGASATA